MNETMTLLLIDDKQTNLFALEQMLEKSNRRFLKATTGKDGLLLALNHEVDLIILDVQMPEMNGFEVAQILQSNNKTRNIPIIFASAEKKERQSVIQGFEEGAADYLSKPLDPEVTKAKVAVLLKIQLQNRQLVEKNNALSKAEFQIKQLNEDLRKNLDQIHLTNQELESFTYSVSHDLRAPVRALLGFSTIIEEETLGKLNGAAQEALFRIQQNSAKMNRMIDDLLELSKLGRKKIVSTAVDMNSLVEMTLSELTLPVATTMIVDNLATGYGDRSLLAHVWTNLISNAVKYSRKNERPRIEITSVRQNDGVVYHVKDNGAGFDMEYSGKLFSAFHRLHKASDFEGTGVGLAIVHRIISGHGGRVWAEGAVGKGALFSFFLPGIGATPG